MPDPEESRQHSPSGAQRLTPPGQVPVPLPIRREWSGLRDTLSQQAFSRNCRMPPTGNL